ncbi:hypothetical protein E2C01_009665 [Portunus trituberculatus]|uniref:Uncharacterized protein n=1 Tax=Portunus trituberculatus TaxID=210409 RepID=A0A5B7D6D3_PORTR|nr:hypothetical protein [Portunus trituberculatus]
MCFSLLPPLIKTKQRSSTPNPLNEARSRSKRYHRVQDSTQKLEQEVEEVTRLGRFSEGVRRLMKVRMRSVEKIMTRKRKLADDTEHKDIWIKRDMNLEDTEKEKVLRNEAKEKTRKGWRSRKGISTGGF